MTRENRWSRGGWGLAVMGGLGIWLVWREIQNRLTPINPGLAARYGLHLTRAPQRVLAVTAHQDDLELFVGGTLRLLALAGSQITVVVATGGCQTSFNSTGVRQTIHPPGIPSPSS